VIGSFSTSLDYLGVGFFAVSGAIAAVERRQDIVAMLFFGAITGIGGGTLRDLLIGTPVFWVHQPGYLIVCLAASALVGLSKGRGMNRRVLLWMDAVGLSAYAVVGAVKAADAGLAPPVGVAMGVLTACFGGVLRDVLSEQPSVLLRREIYVTAAIGAASTYLVADALGLGRFWCILGGMLAGLVLRGGALLKGWRLPVLQTGGPNDGGA
jgi:uncharacterized membrane protein YeiH